MALRTIAGSGSVFLGSLLATGWFLAMDDSNGQLLFTLVSSNSSFTMQRRETTADLRGGWHAVGLSVVPGGGSFARAELWDNGGHTGVLGGPVAYGESGFDISNNLVVGSEGGEFTTPFGTAGWAGRIHRAAFWKEALGDQPMQAITGINPTMTVTDFDNVVAQGNNAGAGGSHTPDPPYLYWKMQETPGATTAVDAEGHMNAIIQGPGHPGVTLGVRDDFFTQPPAVTNFDFDGTGTGRVVSTSGVPGGPLESGYGRDFTFVALVTTDHAVTTKLGMGRMVQ